MSSSYTLVANDTTVQNLYSITVNHPTAGTVLIMASWFVSNFHNTSTNDEICRMSLETTSTGMTYLHNFGSHSEPVPVGTYAHSVSFHRVFTVSGAGSTTHYLNAQSFCCNNSTWTIYNPDLVALYFPTT